MEHFIINIGRQLGAGGRDVGHKLATDYGIAYYDKEILAMAAQESGYSEKIFERNDEKKGFFAQVVRGGLPLLGGGNYYQNAISDDALFRLQSEAIRKAAADHSCVFIGRLADYVLRDMARCVNVFLTADPQDRIRAIGRREGVDEHAARRIMEKGDRRRADFYNFYSDKRWGAAASYDLCLNTSVLGIDGSVSFIEEFVARKLGVRPGA